MIHWIILIILKNYWMNDPRQVNFDTQDYDYIMKLEIGNWKFRRNPSRVLGTNFQTCPYGFLHLK
jgi:hypothetical protein